jgi:hypothetical protein
MRVHPPDTGHVAVEEPIDAQNINQKIQNILKGSVRAVGRWQYHRANFQALNLKNIYHILIYQVAPTSGFKIGILTVTWERVSASLFLLTSIVAVFIQETMFGEKRFQL